MNAARTTGATAARFAWLETKRGMTLVVSVLGILLLFQSIRLARGFFESHRLGALLLALSSAGLPTDSAEGVSGSDRSAVSPLERIPSGSLPGPVLADLVRLLEQAGLDAYEWQFLDPKPEAEAEVAVDRRALRAPTLARNAPPDFGTLAAAPEDLLEWRVFCRLKGDHASFLRFLGGVERETRLWEVPVWKEVRTDEGLEAEVLLRSWTRAPSSDATSPVHAGDAAGEGASPESGSPDEAMSAAVRERDPFRLPRAEDTSVADWELPRLSAVLHGHPEVAFLDGEAAHVGEWVGDFELLEIRLESVRVRHENGRSYRLGLGADAEREDP